MALERVVGFPVSAEDTDARGLDGRLNRLANERATIYATRPKDRALSEADRLRLQAIERELDDGFALRRQRWAARDAHRFTRRREAAPRADD